VDLFDAQSPPIAQITDGLRDLGGVKFDHATASTTGEVIVGSIRDHFVVRVLFAQSMLIDQTDFLKQRQRPVDSRQADIGVPRFGQIMKRFRIQVSLALLENVPNEPALPRHPQAALV
jgi:hypothetical protein